MATARPVGTVRRSGGATGGSGTGAPPDVSPARWGGVALVLVALLGTILLAVVSPSDGDPPALSGAGAVPATEAPAASLQPADGRLPTTAPAIVSPRDGTVDREWQIPVTVTIPDDPIARRLLGLAILRDGEVIRSLEQLPRTKNVTVQGVKLEAGRNVLKAALTSAAGRGPESPPIVVQHDRDAPELGISQPEDGLVTFDEEVDVEVVSEVGASIVIENQKTKRERTYTVPSSGTVSATVRLDIGRNRLTVTATDSAGMRPQQSILVVRRDGRPVIKLNVAPRQVKRGELPKDLRITVEVTDAEGDAIEEADVSFTLRSGGWTQQESTDQTDADGQASWRTQLRAGSSTSTPTVTVEVLTPNGDRGTKSQDIRVS
jgi:hypothetical protein